MKPFNLDEYLANPSRKLVTKDGKSVRILCTDRKSRKDNYIPIMALVKYNDEDVEYLQCYTVDGKSMLNDNLDLFFAPEKKEGWINIYVHNWLDGQIYPSKEKALSERDDNTKYITTIKIEWEE